MKKKIKLKRNIKNKKGVSPIIASVLLIAIVMVLAGVIFVWLKGMTHEAVTKLDGQNIKLVCEDVVFDASYFEGSVYIVNTGNVPIYKMKVKKVLDASHSTITLEGQDPNLWPTTGLGQGMAYSQILLDTYGLKEIILIPILVGRTDKGTSMYTCEERQGYRLIV